MEDKGITKLRMLWESLVMERTSSRQSHSKLLALFCVFFKFKWCFK